MATTSSRRDTQSVSPRNKDTSPLIVLYGIKNCDTVKKARTWLESAGVAYCFHDYKTSGIDRACIERWCAALGWETVINRAGTTFRKLPDADKASLDQPRAIKLMIAQPLLIRRPVAEGRGILLTGFKPEVYKQHFTGSGDHGRG